MGIYRRLRLLCVGLGALGLCSGALGGVASAQVPDFAGWGWGVGLAWADNLHGGDLVDPENVIVDEAGIVRVQKVRNVRPRIVMETHQTFQVGSRVGIGPFVAVEPGGGSNGALIRSAGAGIMFELKRPSMDPATGRVSTDGPSFNVGVGVLVEMDATRLASGYQDGELSPTPTAQFQTREEAMLLIITAVGF